MNNYDVRISEITIRNFKNVKNGKINFDNDNNRSASVLGLYGQNGSGKTALIDSLEMLKLVLSGVNLPEKYVDYINVDSDFATFIYKFLLMNETKSFDVIYEFSIKALPIENDTNVEISNVNNPKRKIAIFNEKIQCPIISGKGVKLGRLIDTYSDDIFVPASKKQLLIGKDKTTDINLFISKRMIFEQSRSFVFSKELLSIIRNRKIDDLNNDNFDEFSDYRSILENLVNFGNYCLFIVNTATSGVISLNAQPISFKYTEDKYRGHGTMLLPLNNEALIPEQQLELVSKLIRNMNIVLSQIVPGLTIDIKDYGKQTNNDGKISHRIELISLKNTKEIPLKYESDGIKKIISILQLLIVVYNESSTTVVIDELDAGIFEYLLGEILRIISEKGKGQLIFTSHNLRPLETIDKSFVCFTTTNVNNRYTRLTNVKNTNNLRDLYYRDIMLSDRSYELYDHTKNSEIAFAFKEAGRYVKR